MRVYDFNDHYLHLLLIALAGYAILGKGFAYIGIQPLFIGEMVLALGLLVFLRSGCWIAALTSVPSLVLVVLAGWTLFRTVPYIGVYGIDALRDSVLVFYCLFAYIIVALIIENPSRLLRIIYCYSGFAWFFGLCGGMLIAMMQLEGAIPNWPSGVPVLAVRSGEIAVHLAGAAIFVLLGLRRPCSPGWMLMLLIGMMAVTASRGAMLACATSIGVAAILGGKFLRFLPFLFLAAFLFIFTYLTDFNVAIGGRSLGPEQIIHNLESIFGTSTVGNLDDTKLWRLRWWEQIQDYTLHGPYFWTGKGFGISLAEADGFSGAEDPPLRSPHSAHLSFLARAGVPGLVLWLLTLATWYVVLMKSMFLARGRGDAYWANLFLWIGCYVFAVIVHSSFDVALEGPMIGIWFWALYGLGIASVMVYRTKLRLRA